VRLLTGRHAPFFAACGAAVLALVAALLLFPALSWAIAANAFFVVYLVLSLVALRRMDADWLKRHASSEDVPVWIIFLVGLVAIVVSVVLLFDSINARPSPDPIEYGLALAAVPLGWFTIHLMAAFHYAREYWQPESGARTAKARQGLEFPRREQAWRRRFRLLLFRRRHDGADVRRRRHQYGHAPQDARSWHRLVLLQHRDRGRGRQHHGRDGQLSHAPITPG
jgi:uncharacterized membrane protein